nr:ribonuclease H-like domain-containing protein [Tanacetum cinerariifolium]
MLAVECGVKLYAMKRGRSQFCDMKGIKREFSVARSPHQNGASKRKNKTIIEAVRTMIVEETLNIRFLENAPNVKGNGPNWIFNIDSLTISMNYVPVVAGFQSNGIARTKDNIVASPKDSAVDVGKKATKVDDSQVLDNGGQDDQVTRSEFEGLLQQERQTEHINSTNSFNTVSSSVNTAGPSFVNAASPSPINVAGTLASTNAFEEHPFKRFSPFKNVFSLPHIPIMTLINDTRIFGNAYDDEVVEKEVDMNNMVSSYTILEAPLTKFLKDHPKDQGNTQEEGIDYDEVFAPVVRIEAIWLFLAYASFKDFVVYQMDVKSDFLYRKIEEEVYVCQPPGFEDLNFPDKVYKVEKALYELNQAPKAWYETLSTYLMDNGFHKGQIDKRLFIQRHKDDILLVQVYVDDIIFRLDITFVVCACARFQVTPKTSHVHAVKRIFRYLNGYPKLGLWYPRDSPFDLEAYSDSDYIGASLNRKSTIGGCQFLGKRLISWQCKKQIIVAYSTAASYCGKKDEYEVWAMKMEYWITNNYMNIWKVIQNGNSMKRTGRYRKGRVIILPPTTVEEHIAVQRESKARTTLLQSIPDDHVADFHYMDDARDIWNAVKARFGRNDESKKMRKSMLKKEFLEFKIEDEDINLKFLRALPSSWSQVALTLKTQGGLELISFDDLYYNLKTLEVDVKGYTTFSSSQFGPSHSAFVSATCASKKMSNGDSLSYSSSTTYYALSNSKTGSHRSSNVIEDVLQSFVVDTKPEQQLAYEDFEQIEKLDLEEMDLKWQIAILSVRVHKFEQKAGRKIDFDTKEYARFNKKKVRCYKCQQRGHFARECMTKGGNDKQRYSSFKIKEIGKKEEDSKALIIIDTLVDWIDHDGESDGVIASKEFGIIVGCDTEDAIEEGATKTYNLINGADIEEASTAGDAGEFALMVSLLRLIDSSMSVRTKVGLGFNNCIRENELGWDDFAFSVVTTNSEDVEGIPLFHSDKSSEVNTNDFASSDSNVKSSKPKPNDTTSCASTSSDLPSFSCNSSDKNENTSRISCNKNGYFNKKTGHFRKNASSVSKLCFVCGSGTHLIKDCDFYEKQMANKTVGIGVGPVHSMNKVNHQNQFVPQVVLLRTGKVNIPPARPQPVPTGKPKLFAPVPAGRQNRPFPVPTDRGYSLSENPFSAAEDEGIFDSGCARSVTGNKERLDDFQGRKVTFRGGEDTEYLVLSKDFKLPNESLVVLRVPRKHNLYTINLNNLCPREHKDETYPILKDFINLVENQLNKKVKAIRCDNGTEFKNAHIMELCKFDGKADEGYIVGYSASNKAYRVYNVPNKRVEETMNLRFLREKPNVQGTQGAVTNPVGTQDADSDSDCDEQVIIAQRATSDAENLGLGFANDTEKLQTQASAKTVPPGYIPVLTGNIPVPPGSLPVPTGSIPVPTGNTVISTYDVLVHTSSSTDSFFDDEPTTRFPSPSDLGNQDPLPGIFSFSSYEDEFGATLNNVASIVKVSPVATTRINTIHPQSLIIRDPTSAVQTRSKNVWVLVDLPKGKYAIETKWILKNKRDTRGIVVQNKARLVAQGHRQDEGINYDEVFASVSRIEAIRLFLAFASYMGFMVYQMDVKSAFLYERIDEEAWCDEFEALMKGEFQMSAMGELTFFLEAVKKIFKYLKGQPKLGLWYPKESPLVLEAYSDSDYAGENKDKKSTTYGCHFLGRRLILWQCKKQNIMATSSTEAEYVAAANCCVQKKIKPKRKYRQATEVHSPSSEIPVKEVLNLEKAKTTQAKEIANLKKRVKKLEKMRKSRPAGLRRLKKVGSSNTVESFEEKDSLGAQEDASRQKRSIKDINQDAEIALIDEAQGRMHDGDMFRVDDLEGNEVIVDAREKIVKKEVSTADPVTTAGEVVNVASVEDSVAPITTTTVDADDELTLAKTLIAIKETKPKDKGKAKMIKPEKPLKKKDQIKLDEEVVRKLEDGMKAKIEEEKRIVREKDEANRAVIEEWDDVQATIDVNRQLAKQMQAQEREQLSIEERSKLLAELIESRRKFNDIKKMFDKVYKRVNTFMDMNTENVEESLKKTQAEVTEGSSKRARQELEQESAKEQKLIEREQAKVADDDTAELKRCLEIVPEDDDDVAIEETPLSSKSPTIVDYKIYREWKKNLEVLRSILKERYKKTKPVDDMGNLLFQTLKTMFEPHVEDIIWKYQQGAVKVDNWKLFDSCGVYCVIIKTMLYYLLVEKMYPFTNSILHQLWTDVRLQVDYEVEMAYDLLRLIRRQINEGYKPK